MRTLVAILFLAFPVFAQSDLPITVQNEYKKKTMEIPVEAGSTALPTVLYEILQKSKDATAISHNIFQVKKDGQTLRCREHSSVGVLQIIAHSCEIKYSGAFFREVDETDTVQNYLLAGLIEKLERDMQAFGETAVVKVEDTYSVDIKSQRLACTEHLLMESTVSCSISVVIPE